MPGTKGQGNDYELYASATLPSDLDDKEQYELIGEMRNARFGTTRALTTAASWTSGYDRDAVAGARVRTLRGEFYFAVDGDVGQDEIEDAIDSDTSALWVLLEPKETQRKRRYGKLILSSHEELYPVDDYITGSFEGQFVTFTRATVPAGP